MSKLFLLLLSLSISLTLSADHLDECNMEKCGRDILCEEYYLKDRINRFWRLNHLATLSNLPDIGDRQQELADFISDFVTEDVTFNNGIFKFKGKANFTASAFQLNQGFFDFRRIGGVPLITFVDCNTAIVEQHLVVAGFSIPGRAGKVGSWFVGDSDVKYSFIRETIYGTLRNGKNSIDFGPWLLDDFLGDLRQVQDPLAYDWDKDPFCDAPVCPPVPTNPTTP